jgi:two-component system CAI-1 autoinducer sensor kinase/phosphatase CqsS
MAEYVRRVKNALAQPRPRQADAIPISTLGVRVQHWLEEQQLFPSVIEDGRAFRYAANAGMALCGALVASWAFASEFDSPLLNALIHLPGVALFCALFVLRRQRTARYSLAERLYFIALFYGASFLPWSLYFYNPANDFALAQALCGCFLIYFVYPLRPASVSIGGGFGLALILAGVAWAAGRPFHGPTSSIVLLLNLPVWMILRTYTDRTTKDKVFAVKVTTDTIAHEMRTPMLSIEASSEALRQTFKRFLAKTLSPEQHLSPYTQTSVRSMFKAMSRIEEEAMRMGHNLNLLLQNASSPKSIPPDTKLVPSIADMLTINVSTYPFYSATDLENIQLVTAQDFAVWLSPVMFDHVITNLLKNALHSIQKAGKGKILIELSRDETKGINTLRFKDSGSGMSRSTLAHIFTPFYTTRSNGQGLGLPFCRKVLALFGADINAESVENEFAEFTIRFPNVEHRKNNASTLPPDDDNFGR